MNKNLIQFDDLQSEKKYSRYGAYLQSKLANLLFALEFQRRIDAAGLALKSIAAQPGWTATNLGPGQSQGVSPLEKGIITITNKLFAHSAEVGARPPLYAATVENVAGGAYVCPDGFRNLHGSPTITDPGRAAQDAAVAARLWAVSEQLTKVSYQIPLLSRA
jgi:NAD(P)-dependent dehydrogenase (short-subunit alcohol dehydrogenase family)